MPDEGGPSGEKDEVGELKQELKRSEQEIKELKDRLESLKGFDLEVDLDKAQKLMDEEKRRSEDYLTRLKYLQADFENYRKRVERDMREMEDYSTGELMKKLLPVLDDLDLAVATVESAPEAKGLLEGVGMVRKNLGFILEGEGLGAIEAVGQPFNAEVHEAVERVDGKENKIDMVVGETRKGYIFKDRVLRPSMVKVESAVKSDSEIE